jgi:hypothetical protein
VVGGLVRPFWRYDAREAHPERIVGG